MSEARVVLCQEPPAAAVMYLALVVLAICHWGEGVGFVVRIFLKVRKILTKCPWQFMPFLSSKDQP